MGPPLTALSCASYCSRLFLGINSLCRAPCPMQQALFLSPSYREGNETERCTYRGQTPTQGARPSSWHSEPLKNASPPSPEYMGPGLRASDSDRTALAPNRPRRQLIPLQPSTQTSQSTAVEGGLVPWTLPAGTGRLPSDPPVTRAAGGAGHCHRPTVVSRFYNHGPGDAAQGKALQSPPQPKPHTFKPLRFSDFNQV